MARARTIQRPRRRQRVETTAPPRSEATAGQSGELAALSVTHWFDSGPGPGAPYDAKLRISGRRIGGAPKRDALDHFTKDEVITGVAPGSGPVSVTSWIHGIAAGEWDVRAELLSGPPEGTWRRALRTRRSVTTPVARAGWSWLRWSLGSARPEPVSTRWAPLVRLTPTPAVVPGSWSALVALGLIVGIIVQSALVARLGVPLSATLLVDSATVIAGLAGAKLWYIALRPRRWRQRVNEGWSVDGSLLAGPLAGIAVLLALELPLRAFLDASTPAFFAGVAIGRMGCFLTGCCAGRCTASRFGVWSSDRRIGARRIPTQLLEAASGLVLGSATLALVLARLPDGAVVVMGAAAYVVVRQVLLRLRAESREETPATPLTAVLLALILVGGAVLLLVPGP